jgi:hypothetical protein
MTDVAKEAKALAGEALERADAALAHLRKPAPLDVPAAEARLSEMLMGAIA